MMKFNKEYYGRDPELIVSFLEKKEIQYFEEFSKNWHDVPVYCDDPHDIYRVSNVLYRFRRKPKTTTANIHVHVCPRKNTVWATADQSPCADNIKVTFDEHGTPIKAEII